ncbi:hypothetical protein cypCar_00028316 [Cyprinus carpio]|nr:hypothetical protein cypCar_00028316 [Cyprinus carpio]
MATEHINGNGTDEPVESSVAVTHSEHFQTLLDAGLPRTVAVKLDEIYIAGLVTHSDLDDRAIEALKEFNEEGALQVLLQFKDSDLSHVQNKSAFLCGVMKTYRQREKQGTKVSDSTKGPDEAKIIALLERTGYTLDVTTGQRKYGGPPPGSTHAGVQPTVGTEIFVGKIPRDLFEDELVPLFEKAGPIWDLRLMMDPLSGLNRGYAFITFCTKEAAQQAVKLSQVFVMYLCQVFLKRFLSSISTEGLNDVILYHQPDDKKKNRGFCFLEYEDHKTAAQARRRLMSGKVKVWGNVVTVEWADPIEDPLPPTACEVMAKVKVLFVRNLASTVTEELLEKTFCQFGKLERVKKLKDYAFIHFEERDSAVKALAEMHGKDLEGEQIEIVFAKPPDQKRKERKAQRQAAKTQIVISNLSIYEKCFRNYACMMSIITTGHHTCIPRREQEDEALEVIRIRTTITATKIITTTTAMTITTTEAATTTPTTATMTFKLTSEEEAAEEPGAPRCPGAAAPAPAEDGPVTLRAGGWGPAAAAGGPEEASSRDVEWYVMCGWSIPGVLAGGSEAL